MVINSISVSTSGAFSEPSSWQSAFSKSGNPLYDVTRDAFEGENAELIAYTRELTETEKSFNNDYPTEKVSYEPTYIWASNDTTVYAVFNTVNAVESNPYDAKTEEETGSGCAASSDPSTFWLSFSSILLAVVLVLAVIALVVKRVMARRKVNKRDAKSQYKVKSRSETQKEIRKLKERQEKQSETETPKDDTSAEETPETVENIDSADENGDDTEQTGYVYGEVQDFGDMTLDLPDENGDKPEQTDNKDGE